MEKQHALQRLEQLQKKLYAIHYACSAMNLDADTVAPKNTSEGRGVALGVLAGAVFSCLLPGFALPDARRDVPAAASTLVQTADVLQRMETKLSLSGQEAQTAPALIFDSAADDVCRSCVKHQQCWQERADETYRLLCGCAGTILRQGQAREGDLPPAFCSACIRAEAFREAVNQALRTQQAELLAFRRSEESRQIACALLGHLARFVGAAGRRPKAQGAPRWRLSLGVRAVGLRGDTLCGDCGTSFQCGVTQYVLLCDGMGTGSGAQSDAQEAISVLQSLLTLGFDAMDAAAMLALLPSPPPTSLWGGVMAALRPLSRLPSMRAISG